MIAFGFSDVKLTSMIWLPLNDTEKSCTKEIAEHFEALAQ